MMPCIDRKKSHKFLNPLQEIQACRIIYINQKKIIFPVCSAESLYSPQGYEHASVFFYQSPLPPWVIFERFLPS